MSERDPREIGVWCCERRYKCEWQAFALHQGLGWGEIPGEREKWREWHDRECGGRLIQLIPPTTTTGGDDMSAETMGQQLARAIFECGSVDDRRATRIQFKAGKLPDRETDLGGFCEVALANLIDGWIKETVRHPPEETI